MATQPGMPPAIGTYSGGTNVTIAGNPGSLVKTGFTFNGWNTSDFGAGTSYAASATYTGNANIVLFASWASTGSVLKIDLTSFTATPYNNNKAVLLSWQTASENNNDHFEVESSAGCNDQWVSVGTVQVQAIHPERSNIRWQTVTRLPDSLVTA